MTQTSSDPLRGATASTGSLPDAHARTVLGLRPRFPGVEGLRAVAALSILLGHVQTIDGGNPDGPIERLLIRASVGVTLFFVLSGFLLYRPFVAARLTGSPRPSLSRYALRRAARILPAYWVALTILLALSAITGVTWGNAWQFYFFGQVYGDGWNQDGIVPAWSLDVEIVFYLTLPLLVLLGERFGAARHIVTSRSPHGREFVFLLMLCAAYLVMRICLAPLSDTSPWVRSTIGFTFDWFVLGMVIAVASVVWERPESRPPWVRRIAHHCWALLASAAVLYVTDVFVVSERALILEHFVFGAIAALLVLSVALPPDGRTSPIRILGGRLLTWLGVVSYGVFLWHYPIIEWLHSDVLPNAGRVWVGAAAVAITTVAAATSWYALERPLIERAQRSRHSADSRQGLRTVWRM